MSRNREIQAAIVGGGLAGLCMAAFFRWADVQPISIESAGEFDECGEVVELWPETMTLQSIDTSAQPIAVTFENGVKESFDLVVGANGADSRTREALDGATVISCERHRVGPGGADRHLPPERPVPPGTTGGSRSGRGRRHLVLREGPGDGGVRPQERPHGDRRRRRRQRIRRQGTGLDMALTRPVQRSGPHWRELLLLSAAWLAGTTRSCRRSRGPGFGHVPVDPVAPL